MLHNGKNIQNVKTVEVFNIERYQKCKTISNISQQPKYFSSLWKICTPLLFVCFSQTERKDLIISSITALMCVFNQGRMETFQQLTSLHLILPFFTHTLDVHYLSLVFFFFLNLEA